MVAWAKDGRSWPIGTHRDVAWLDESLGPASRHLRRWLPAAFEASCQLRLPYDPAAGLPDDPAEQLAYDKAVISLLREFGETGWWLGYLEYGTGIDLVFDQAPRTRIFTWDYVVVQAGPDQALNWRSSCDRSLAWKGALPDLMFPDDHSWVLFTPWDEYQSFLGGPRKLVERCAQDSFLSGRVGPILSAGFGS